MECRLGQVNVGRGKIAMEDMVRVCSRMGLDLVLIQEPYVTKGHILGCEGRWFYDTRAGVEVGSAVVVLNEEMNALMIGTETDGACVSVSLDKEGKHLYVVGLYCRPSEGIDGHLRKMDEIVRRKAGMEVVIGGDFNARSRQWYSDRTDRRGEKVEEVVFALDLEIANQWSKWATFENTQGGRSNIDATVGTRDVVSRIHNWSVLEESLSDHRLVSFDVRCSVPQGTKDNEMRVGSCNLREVDWVEFDNALVQ